MIARYVLKGFRRHKGRTAIMALALAFVATMLIVLNNTIATTRRQVVDLIAREVGTHDIALSRTDTSAAPFVAVSRTVERVRTVHPSIQGIYPRFQTDVEVARGATNGSATLVAFDAGIDTLGTINVLEGTFEITGDRAVITRDTADAYDLAVGDQIVLSYVLPVPREVGETQAENISVNRSAHRFTVSGIALQSGLGSGIQNGVLVDVGTVQEWLGLPDRAERLVIALDPSVYNTLNVESSVFRVRRIAERIRVALGEERDSYAIEIEKAESLDGAEIAFSMIQTLTVVYGFLSMGVVGLLVYSLINANVEDRRRDLAFLRIVGARRRDLFALVIIEVMIVGAIGIGLGMLVGQALSTFVIDRMLGPLIGSMIANEGSLGGMPVLEEVRLVITPWSLVSTALIAGTILLLSALAPARKAAHTKIRYAIDPGSADNLQVEDLAALRERRYNWNITLAGLVLTIMWGLIFVGQNYLYAQGNESVLGAYMFGGMALLILGVSLLFFTLTIPFERLALLFSRLISPRLTFFAARNVRRAKQRNTVITLMIVFSATLPTFLGTTAALTESNFDVNVRQSSGAPIESAVWRRGSYYMTYFEREETEYLRPAFLERYTQVAHVGPVVGLTYGYQASARNLVRLRLASVDLHGLTASPLSVVYPDLTEMVGDGDAAFARMFEQIDTIVLTAGFAEYMDVGVGDVLIVAGAGLDHEVPMRVVGLIERMAGFWGIGRNMRDIRWGGSPAFVSLDTFLRLTTDPALDQVCVDGACSDAERDAPLIERILADVDPTADPALVSKALRTALSDRNDIRVEVTEEQVRMAHQEFVTMRVILLVLTVLSLITSVLGVFSVIYVTVQTRRLEIGMVKAIGITSWQLTGTFAIESLVMTVSATLAGTTAGTGLGYLFYVSNNSMQNVPTIPAFDTLTVGFVLVLVIVASLISAIIASRGIVRLRVTDIIRGI
ncbi:MAG: ABC transporter permease [Anaerolineae bacterium]|nr:ABC transporter permease [Anaerolineae bacterium]